MKIKQSSKASTLLFTNILLAIYSLSGFFSKAASKYTLSNVMFYVLYGGMILILGIYAIGWQQVIKKLPLTTAYANKAVTVVWGMIYGLLFFQEKISIWKILGALVIIIGVWMFVKADAKEE